MVYFDGQDFLVGGEVLKDLSGFTLKKTDTPVELPKESDPEVNIHAMDLKGDDIQPVQVLPQSQYYSTVPFLIRPDSCMYMPPNVVSGYMLTQQAQIQSCQQPIRGYPPSVATQVFQQSSLQPYQQPSQQSFPQYQPIQSYHPFNPIPFTMPMYSGVPQRDHPTPAKMTDVNSTEESEEEVQPSRGRCKRHVWTEKEDEELRILVAKYKGKQWKQVSRGMIKRKE